MEMQISRQYTERTGMYSYRQSFRPFETNHIGPTKKDYMVSKVWNIKRKAILKRDTYTCQCCGIKGVPLEVHHITYRNYLAERPEELTSLCRKCHQLVHNIYGYNYSNTFPINTLRAWV